MEKTENSQEQLKKYNPIIVYYISVSNIRNADLDYYMDKINKKIIASTLEAESIIIPIDGETRIECINPKYIIDGELIKKHERLMGELHEHLKKELNE